jgi:CMP/dCMP kinase
MIITVSGLLGAGKDTIGKLLAERLGYRFYSMGDILGEVAQKRGMTINELASHAQDEKKIDKDIDDYQKRLGETGDDFVIVGHMSAFFIPHAFKIFLKASLEERARRVFNDLHNRPDESYHSEKETKEALSRLQSLNERRYMTLYKHNPYDESHYDLVIDTEDNPPDRVISIIMEAIEKRKS